MSDIPNQAKKVRVVIFDVDGVLTDGSLYIGDDGQEYKAFNSRDGHGMVMLQQTGVKLAIITGRTSEVVRIRMEGLGVEHVYQGQRDKLPAYADLKRTLGIDDDVIAYIGDDVVDLPIMHRVGLPIAVADAHPLVLKHAAWHTSAAGGRGAAREACEMIMDAQGTLTEMMQAYL